MMTAMGYPTYYPDVSSDYILLPSSVFLGLRIPPFSQGLEEAMGNNYYTVNPSYIKSMIGVTFFFAREKQ